MPRRKLSKETILYQQQERVDFFRRLNTAEGNRLAAYETKILEAMRL
jgi:hypothetical protein